MTVGRLFSWVSSRNALRSDQIFLMLPLLENSASPATLNFMAMTKHCWKCGTEYKLPGAPGRSECCPRCNSDLKVCRNCISYDPRIAQQCRDPRAEPVAEKDMANYCEFFEMARREFSPLATNSAREDKARETLKK